MSPVKMHRTNTTHLKFMTLDLSAGTKYVEYLEVLKGRVRFTLGNQITERGPEDGPVRIERYVSHESMRADALKPEGEKGDGDVEVREWMDPNDGLKAVIFHYVMSTFNETRGEMGLRNGLQLVTTVAYVDTFVVLARGPMVFYPTHALYMTWTAVAWLLGYRAWYKEYTPARYHAVAATGGKSKVKSL